MYFTLPHTNRDDIYAGIVDVFTTITPEVIKHVELFLQTYSEIHRSYGHTFEHFMK